MCFTDHKDTAGEDQPTGTEDPGQAFSCSTEGSLYGQRYEFFGEDWLQLDRLLIKSVLLQSFLKLLLILLVNIQSMFDHDMPYTCAIVHGAYWFYSTTASSTHALPAAGSLPSPNLVPLPTFLLRVFHYPFISHLPEDLFLPSCNPLYRFFFLTCKHIVFKSR